jgi:adhesin/invasin
MISRCITLLLAGAVALTACGDDGSGPSSTPASVQSLSGNNQVGTVGQNLPGPITVRVTDIRGVGVSGVTVNFEVTTGGGTIVADIVGGGLASGNATAQVAETVSTDANGQAEATWTLGPTAGEQRATATVAGVGSAIFTATAEAGAPATLTIVSGDGQEGSTGEQLPNPLVVIVEDDFGNAVPGATVNWQVTAGGAEFPSASSQTDASGNASTTVTLRAPGPLVVSAGVSGVPTVTFAARAVGTGSLDFVAAKALVDGTVDFFLAQETVESLFALTPLIDGVVNATSALPTIRSRTPTLRGLASAFQSGFNELRARSGSANPAFDIPPALLGRTLVYDPSTSSYVVDPSRTGAPANGVRFVLYRVDPISGLPVEPLVEIGHVDIVDTGAPPTVAIAITVTATGGATVLAYDISGTFTQTNLDVTFSGFVSDGVTQIDFEFVFQATPTSALIDYSLEIGEFVVGYEQGSQAGAGYFEFSLADVSGENSLNALVLFDEFDTVLAGSDVTFNGTKVAFFTGTLSSVQLRNIEGNPFTLAELEALVAYVVAVDRLTLLYLFLLDFGFIFL